MHFELDPELEAFRQEIRDFVRDNLPENLKLRQQYASSLFFAHEDDLEWSKIISKKNWHIYAWPEELGGLGWSPLKQFVFEDETHRLWCPPVNLNTIHMIGPLIYKIGDEQIKERFLGKMRRAEIAWCQGFSEPGSGSDLASLRTRADLVGDKYIVNGQKIWTSGAFEANWGFFLVKTDITVKPQLGASFLLIDMNSPGIVVRRIPQINAERHLCEVFLTNVEVPKENLLGEANKGWTYAKMLLDGERTGSSYIFWNKREMRRVKALAQAEAMAGNPIATDPIWLARLAKTEAELTALEWSVLRELAHEHFHYGTTATASALKVRGSEMQQAITELQVDLIGEKALRYYDIDALGKDAGTMWPEHVVGRTNMALILRAATIYGGAKQIQKNIIAKAAFGL